MATGFYARPNPSFGYWRGGGSTTPIAGGQPGSGYGPAYQGIGFFSAGQGPPPDIPSWTPTITYLLVLVLVELIAVGCLGRFVGDFHIG